MPRPRTRAGRGVSARRMRDLMKVRPWSHQAELFDEVSSVSHARAFVAGHLLDHKLADLVDDIELVVSELVTNALVHASSPYMVTLGASKETVRVEMLDGSHALPTLGAARSSDTSGRGMAIVEALSREWGVSDRGADGKSVWAEFDIGAALSN